jgi:hypothetical protein
MVGQRFVATLATLFVTLGGSGTNTRVIMGIWRKMYNLYYGLRKTKKNGLTLGIEVELELGLGHPPRTQWQCPVLRGRSIVKGNNVPEC